MTSRDPNTLRAQYLEISWRCYFATIANYYSLTVCCKAVRSAVLATAWLLVSLSIKRIRGFGNYALYKSTFYLFTDLLTVTAN